MIEGCYGYLINCDCDLCPIFEQCIKETEETKEIKTNEQN
jgi:hypothetical protein